MPFRGSSVANLRTFLKCRFRQVENHVTKYAVYQNVSHEMLINKFRSRFFVQPDLASEGATEHLLARQRYTVGLNFFGRGSIASEVQVKGHFDPYEGRLGEMITDLLDREGKMANI